MSRGNFVKAIPESVYEGDKILRVEPAILQEYGLYTIRMMMPPRAKDYAVETLAAIISREQAEVDRWNVRFTMYAPDNSGDIDDVGSYFTSDGHMFLDNIGSLVMPQFGPRIYMGYLLGDIQKCPIGMGATAEVPSSLEGLDIEIEQLLEPQF